MVVGAAGCFIVRVVYVSEVLVLGDAQLYSRGMDNGAHVLIRKFAGLIKGWLSFPPGKKATYVLILLLGKKQQHIEMFWFSSCEAVVV